MGDAEFGGSPYHHRRCPSFQDNTAVEWWLVAKGAADVEAEGLVCNRESCRGPGRTLAGDSARFIAGYFSGGVDGMCLGGEEGGGGEPGLLHVDLFCGLVAGMQRRENGCIDVITAA